MIQLISAVVSQRWLGWLLPAWVAALPAMAGEVAPTAAPLPPGVQAVWDLAKAYRETTPSRERICLNGLWQWQPAEAQASQPPPDHWGYFKVPGCWPGITDYLQKDCQTLFPHPAWAGRKPGGVTSAWYQRELAIPGGWEGRRILLAVEYLNSHAEVFLDGRRAGEIHFPGGELDITPACRPGGRHRLTLCVTALPLKGVLLSYTDSASAREVRGAVARRGLCGDVFLASRPAGPRLGELQVSTSVRRREISLNAAVEGLAANQPCRLAVRILEDGRTIQSFTSPPYEPDRRAGGRLELVEKWLPERLWDIHTPHHTLELEVSLLDDAGNLLDTAARQRFGFREFWIDGRDFYLNGSRIFLSAVPLDNAQVGAALATYAAACESLQRLKSFGINFVYTHNYGCEPGSHLGFEEILRAADDTGMLVAFSMPHFSHYEWPSPAADGTNGYARHAAFYARAAQNHPSVVLYSMSHNATGYNEDMNPDLIDGIHEVRDTWAARNVKLALRAEAIVNRLDPRRVVYHHASGNLGTLHAINFYPNFVPIQELSDWFEHWSTEGVKPVFTCEYGAPFSWDWTMYRGWFRGQREFGSAKVPWELCVPEWNAQFSGDEAFQLSEPVRANLRWEARQYAAGNLWHRWDYPYPVDSIRFDERYPVFARYITDNWRAFRGWEVSANSPWEHGHFWKLREGVDRRRRELPVDWENLQRPGFSPDYLDQRYERMDLAFERADWIPTPAAEALLRNNGPRLAWIGGPPDRFTSQAHNFRPGETVIKQLILINNSRTPATCDCRWTLALPQPVTGRQQIQVATGRQERVPLRFTLPATLPPGSYELRAGFQFASGEHQEDSFTIDILPPPAAPPPAAGRIALFDPRGETAAWLKGLGIPFQSVSEVSGLAAGDLLIVGKAALSATGPAPDLRAVRQGLKVILFEQTAEALEKRLGFRVQEYGLRQVFPRVPDHPALAGLTAARLRDWRGAATLVPPRLAYESRPRQGPTVQWCGLPVPRLWRCGNWGSVASVLIEKPARGDFLPLVDGGYGLQYSPLLEFHEGRGLALFCQLDLTGRTEADPAAGLLLRNLLQYALGWQPAPRRSAFYAGESAGRAWLESAGVPVAGLAGTVPAPGQLLLLGPGSGATLAGHKAGLAEWLQTGGSLLAIGLDQSAADTLLPVSLTVKKTAYISGFFPPFSWSSRFAGISPADLLNRDPRDLPLITAGASTFGGGILAQAGDWNIWFCQAAPWQFDARQPANLKRTHRRLAFALSRLVASLGAAENTPLLDRFAQPAGAQEQRWLTGLYLDQPEEWDDPYRFFRW